MSIFTISSKLLVCLQQNLVCWYSIISQSVVWENGITAFKVKVTSKVKNVSECLSGQLSSEPQNDLSPNLVWLCSIMSHSIMQKNWFTVFNVKVTVRAYIIKIMVVYYCEAMCHAEKLVHYLQCQGHSKGLCNQNMTLFTIS